MMPPAIVVAAPALASGFEPAAALAGSHPSDPGKPEADGKDPAPVPIFAVALASFLPVAFPAPAPATLAPPAGGRAGAPPTGYAPPAAGYVSLASLADAAPLRDLSLDDVVVESVQLPAASPQPATLLGTLLGGQGAALDPSADAPLPPPALATLAASAAPATSTGAAGAVIRSMAALQPAFRNRLTAVIARLSHDYGYDVDVRETYRTQARQDQLFAQGRTTPGPVVTWTDHSLHSQGLAADLAITNAPDPALANQRLAQVAAQLGLRTLGPQDPGHVESTPEGSDVPRAIAGRATAAPASDLAPAPAAAPSSAAPAAPAVPPAAVAQPARVARVATVASVASVARVAAVARVAVAGAEGTPAAPVTGHRLQAPSPSNAAASSAASANSAHEQGGTNPDGSAPDDRAPRRDQSPPVTASQSPVVVAAPDRAAAPAHDMNHGILAPAPIEAPAPRTSIGAQIARIDAAHDAVMAQPVSQIVLRLDGPNGATDRIRVNMRGATVQMAVGTQDRTLSQRLTSDMGQLRATLQEHGLDVGTLRVHDASAASRTDDATARAGGIPDAAPATASNGNPGGGGDPPRGSSRGSGGSNAGQPRRQWGNPGRRSPQPKPHGESAS